MRFQCDCDKCRNLTAQKMTHRMCDNKAKHLMQDLKKQKKIKEQYSQLTDESLAHKYNVTRATMQYYRRKTAI